MPLPLIRSVLPWAVALIAGVWLFGSVFRVLVAVAPYLAVIAVAAVLVWTFLGTRDAAAFVPPPAATAAPAGQSGPSPAKLGKAIDQQAFATRLREGAPIGMPPWLATEIARRLPAFLLSTAPPKPWSLMVVSDAHWNLQDFLARFGAALGVPPRSIPTLECTTLTEFSGKEIAKLLAAAPVPVLVINGAEQLHRHASPDRLTSPLEVALQGRDAALRHVAILIFERANTKDLLIKATGATGAADTRTALREHRAVVRGLTKMPAQDVTTVCILSPPTKEERLTILWEEFCRGAATEFSVSIENAGTLDQTRDDSMWGFLEEALIEWNQHGMSEARDFVRASSEQALAQARIAGLRQARAWWHPDEGRVSLQKTGGQQAPQQAHA